MNESVNRTIIQISWSCVEWWFYFVCSLRFDLFHDVFCFFLVLKCVVVVVVVVVVVFCICVVLLID